MKSKRILIVEDNNLEFKQLKFFLEEHGYTVNDFFTDSFEEALSQLTKFQPDLVLIDINLRGDRTGLALAFEIKQNYQIPFIFTSSIDDYTIVDIALELADYIHKPFQEKQILTTIKRVFRKSFEWKAPINDILWLSVLGQNNKVQDAPKYPVKLSDIEWIKTNNKLKKGTLVVKTSQDKDKPGYETRKTLGELYSILPNNFVQVSEAHIVNEKKVTKFIPISRKKKGYIYMGSQRIPVTKSYLKKLNERFNT
ncbi:MAG: response regulator transcription factor [Bacteroidia bacterium]